MGTETDIKITDCIDYVRLTAGHENDVDKMLPAMPSLSRTGEILDRGSYGYNKTFPLDGGGRIMWHSEDKAMKYCIELSGDPLEELRRDGFEVEEVMAYCLSGRVARVSFTRLDYATDVENGGGSIIEVFEAWEKGKIKTRFKVARFIRSSRSEYNADTVEFGNREASDRFIRCYHKGAQQRTPWLDKLRLEVEIKKRRANPFAMSIVRNGRAEAGRRELREAIKSKVGWLNAAVMGTLAPHTVVPRREAHPNEFVKNTVIPFIKNHHGELTQETKALLLMAVEDYITLA